MLATRPSPRQPRAAPAAAAMRNTCQHGAPRDPPDPSEGAAPSNCFPPLPFFFINASPRKQVSAFAVYHPFQPGSRQRGESLPGLRSDRRGSHVVHAGRAPARAGSARRWSGSLAGCSRERLARRGGHEGLRLEGQGRARPGAGDDHAWLSEDGARVAPEEEEEGTGRVRRAGRDVRLWKPRPEGAGWLRHAAGL